MNQYTELQSVRNSEYKSAYAEWVAGLSPKQRRKLEAQGLLEAQVDPFHVGKQNDVSEFSIPVPQESGPDENAVVVLADSEGIWAALRLLIAELLADDNPSLAVECLALVSGIGFMGESMASIAKRHRVTRAAVSKRCIHLTQQLELFPSRAMRSLTAREAYRTTQKSIQLKHERFNSQ